MNIFMIISKTKRSIIYVYFRYCGPSSMTYDTPNSLHMSNYDGIELVD